jgi:hypothetical protein
LRDCIVCNFIAKTTLLSWHHCNRFAIWLFDAQYNSIYHKNIAHKLQPETA